jgi:hypothetical protein
MKLKELIEIVELSRNDNGLYMDNLLYGKNLEKYKKIIMNTDEFKECDSLEILEHPLVKSNNGEILTVPTIKLSDVMKFKGKCYLLSLTLTPEMYDPNQLIKPVKNGAAMGPVIYDPMTFEPRKHILLTWSPEMAQDLLGTNNEETLRNDIHKLLDDVLDNPDEYQTKGFRGVLVRGLFEVVENGENTEVKEYDIDLKKNESDANETKERFDNILKKNKELEDRIFAEEKHQTELAKLIKLKKESNNGR